jgi:hypothetical protein
MIVDCTRLQSSPPCSKPVLDAARRRAAEEVDIDDIEVEELEPVPVADKNIDAAWEGDDSREEEAWTRREGYISYFFVCFCHLSTDMCISCLLRSEIPSVVGCCWRRGNHVLPAR